MMDDVECSTDMHTRLHSFMKKGMYTDINFIIGESKIKAHKVILASCSPVFQAMFDSNMDEAQSNEVVLTDVDEELFLAFLDYLYIRDAKIEEKYAQGMLILADKYDIEPLTLICDGVIRESLNPENAVDSYLLADLYRRDHLKSQINLFISENHDAVSTHSSWAKLEEHFDAMTGIFRSFQENNSITNERQDEVTWIAKGVNWLSGASKFSFLLRGFEPNIALSVIPCTGPSNFLSIHINAENKLQESFQTTLVVTLSRHSVTISHTKIFLPWAPNSTGTAKVFVLHNQLQKLTYPFQLTVAVKKTEPIDQHPYLKIVKEHTHRFTDALVSVGEVKFPVHKLVLAAKSRFFSKLFDKCQNEYPIDGMTENTFKILMEYMYSECNPSEDQVDMPLLKGAELFQLTQLMDYCFATLQGKITCDTAIEMCLEAEELELSKLYSEVIEFIVKKPKEVLNSAKWPVMKNHPRVMKELLNKMSHQNKDALPPAPSPSVNIFRC